MTGRSVYTRADLEAEARQAVYSATRGARNPDRGLARVRVLKWSIEIGPQGTRLVVHAVGSARDGRTMPLNVTVAL